MGDNQTFNIQFVANITGINPHTIRAWEKRYNAITPQRDVNGRRLYTDSEIKRLKQLNKLVQMGNSISDVASLPSEELISIDKQYETQTIHTSKDLSFDYDLSLQNISMSLNFFKLDVFNHELYKAITSLSNIVFALKIVQPVIDQIRQMKKDNLLSKNQREQIFLILKSQLNKKIYTCQKTSSTTSKRVLIAAPEGRLNELGSMVATLIFVDMGYNVDYIGAGVDAEILGQITAQFKPDKIFIGLNYSKEFSETESKKYLDKVCQYTLAKTEILIGAYDFCINHENSNIKCFSNFEDLYEASKDHK
jgi:DNA-binding transcriptional MerR regulator